MNQLLYKIPCVDWHSTQEILYNKNKSEYFNRYLNYKLRTRCSIRKNTILYLDSFSNYLFSLKIKIKALKSVIPIPMT